MAARRRVIRTLEEKRAIHAAQARAWRATPQGKASMKKYYDSPKGQALKERNRIRGITREKNVDRWSNKLALFIEEREQRESYIDAGCPIGTYKKS